MPLTSIDPSTGETLTRYPEHSAEEVRRLIEQADEAGSDWRGRSFAERGEALVRAAAALEERAEEHAELMALEMGKPMSGGRAEIAKCAWVCRHYAEHAEGLLAAEEIATGARRSFVSYQPLGVVLAVMPWNFPFWQVFRAAAPALMAGNTMLLKHAANVTGCALAIEELLRSAGLPEGVFRTLRVGSEAVAGILEHPLVRAATLTGSVAAGQAVGAKAGSLIKKTVLELGGSDAYLVLADADLELAATTCARSRLTNSGQSCIAAKRFVVVAAVREGFERRFVEAMARARMGHPLDAGVEVGPLARLDLREELHDQVRRSVAAGARCLLGGELPAGPGAYYPPTVLTGVGPGMPAFDEELFGPVAAIVPAADEEHAIRLANQSRFGLGAAVFTRDLARGERIAERELEAGCCFVNAEVKSDPRLPFGGIKESGFGRELGAHGIRELVNVKTVWVEEGTDDGRKGGGE
jgi:succinate-semialdehyde dehydrogenase / glutarate-semialdehyde dehydrogenase